MKSKCLFLRVLRIMRMDLAILLIVVLTGCKEKTISSQKAKYCLYPGRQGEASRWPGYLPDASYHTKGDQGVSNFPQQ